MVSIRELLKRELERMPPEELKKPIIARMGKSKDVITGEELKEILGGKGSSLGGSSPNVLTPEEEVKKKLKRILG